MSLPENDGLPPGSIGASPSSRYEVPETASAPEKEPPLTLEGAAGPGSLSQPELTGRRPTTSRLSQPHTAQIATAAASLEVPKGELPEAKTRLPKSENSPQSMSPRVEEQPLHHEKFETTHSASTSSTMIALLPATSRPIATSTAVEQILPDVASTNETDRSTSASPAILTRDFAQSQISTGLYPSKAVEAFLSRPYQGIITSSNIENEKFAVGSYVHISQEELGYESSELDRSIAIKKQAAAKALLKLHEVMAMPTWTESSNIGRLRASTKVPSHWRDLSIEDGSPIAPNAIFKQVKMPAMNPPLSRHSTFKTHQKRDSGQSNKNVAIGTAALALAYAPREPLKQDWPTETSTEELSGTVSSSESAEHPRAERRGRKENKAPKAKRSHSRIGSTISVNSGTSAHSLPYHMVPARGSSIRDSLSSGGEFGEPARAHVGGLGWQ